jgi:hypothetical protein
VTTKVGDNADSRTKSEREPELRAPRILSFGPRKGCQIKIDVPSPECVGFILSGGWSSSQQEGSGQQKSSHLKASVRCCAAILISRPWGVAGQSNKDRVLPKLTVFLVQRAESAATAIATGRALLIDPAQVLREE